MLPSSLKPVLMLHTAIFLLACNGLFAKLIPLPAWDMTQMRSVIAALAIGFFLRAGRQPYRLKNRRDYGINYLLGLLMGLHWVTFFYAMQISTVAIGMLSLSSYPIITVFLEALVNKRWPQKVDVLAASIVVLGVYLMVPEWHMGSNTAEGAIWGLLSAICFGLRNILLRHYLSQYPSATLMLHQLIIVGVSFTLFCDYSHVGDMSFKDWFFLLILGTVSTALAHSFLAATLRFFTAKSVALVGCIQPVIATLIAWMFLNEQPGWHIIVGGSVILAASVFETMKLSGPKEST